MRRKFLSTSALNMFKNRCMATLGIIALCMIAIASKLGHSLCENEFSKICIDKENSNLNSTPKIDLTKDIRKPVSTELSDNDDQNISITHFSLTAGQNLSTLLNQFNLTNKNIFEIEQAISPYISVRNLQVGDKIDIAVNKGVLRYIKFEWQFAKNIQVSLQDAKWETKVIDLPTRLRERYVNGKISGSLYQSARSQKVSSGVIQKLVTVYSHSVDFQRTIKKDDEYIILYSERYLTDKPAISQLERIDYFELKLSGKSMPLINYKTNNGIENFYDTRGNLADSFLMKTPIDGARLSSYFGRRKHPILGYSRLHKGLDFGAPINTPIMAAGHGHIEKIGNGGTYGKRIIIKHSNAYHTLYAHLNGFAKNLKQGSEVKQGDIIGYLGNTGLSEARHLHYEVHKNGKAINPLTLKQHSSSQLSDHQLEEFKRTKMHVYSRLMAYQTKNLAYLVKHIINFDIADEVPLKL